MNENYMLCAKYGEPVNDHIYFNKIKLDRYYKDRHLGNFVGCNINDSTDVTHTRSDFIGYFNKCMSNSAFIQPAILSNLFKTYCCSYYGSILWLLGPLMGQYHIKYQLYMKDIKML